MTIPFWTASAADQHGPQHDDHRRAQALRRGPKSWAIVALYLAFDALLMGFGIGLIRRPIEGLDRLGGWALLVSGGLLFLIGVAYLIHVWLVDRPRSDTLFCKHDDADDRDEKRNPL